MGYVRMMRSGGIHCCANASVYLPIVDTSLEFVTMCNRDGISKATVDAATNLECDISHLRRNYAEGTEYFKVTSHNHPPSILHLIKKKTRY